MTLAELKQLPVPCRDGRACPTCRSSTIGQVFRSNHAESHPQIFIAGTTACAQGLLVDHIGDAPWSAEARELLAAPAIIKPGILGVPAQSLDCIHRGDVVGTVKCPTCSGSVELKIHGCATFGRCMLSTHPIDSEPIQRCAACGGRQPSDGG